MLNLEMDLDRGYIQVYTGNGKGKTTCMLGLTLRACGAQKKVLICQFMKKGQYSEIKAVADFLPQVELFQFGSGKFISKETKTDEDMSLSQAGYEKALDAVSGGEYDIVIMDEINVAVAIELITEKKLLELMDAKSDSTELILTGRYATENVMEKADLVTEMKEIKHYCNKGVNARVGIEM